MSLYPQKIVGKHLRTAIAPYRVVSSPPSEISTGWVHLQLLSQPQDPVAPVDWLRECYFQLDCYAGHDGGWPEADTLAEAVREAWMEMRGVHDGGVVTNVRIEGGSMQEASEPPFEPARPRMIVTATAWIHP